ncbi:helix-turn-helix domain-containing protein [Streptomyces sp. C10-9-1]|uniref:IclR family transcriptional regulator n=1 Tax=Streptomyces sp. C10-9-1 TaxID=1859285 RepID=UPI002110F689|nr:IclR family transcriptional regulator C-terminal domain-containing protein [Streptomyces sp. C10-9-1]MCQ6551792.1 helix-turn-helix domain-containing protein [Streptomyces sp. C10-9-1]
MPSPAGGPTGPQSVDRALEILDIVADAAGPVGARDLAGRLGCSLSTVYHLLAPLTARGHLARTADGYAPGPRVASLHRSYRRHLGLDPRAAELLPRLRRATGAEAYLTAYRDGRIVMTDSTVPVTDREHPFLPGPETRAHATAHGKALLARVSRPARRRYLAEHGMARYTGRTITEAERFEAELAGVRAQGFAVSIGEADTAFTCLAAVLPGGAGVPDGALHAVSVSLPTADFLRRRGEIRAAVARAAAGRLP